MSSNTFKYPTIYNFPPFFTKQPNLQTFQIQLQIWQDLILDYCKFYKIWSLSINGQPNTTTTSITDDDDDGEEDVDNDDIDIDVDISKNSIFKNDKIERYAKSDFILDIINHMIKNGKCEWIDANNHKFGLFIYWYTLEEWADKLYDWIDNTGQNNTVLTLYEIRKSELTENQEFNNINLNLLIKILEILVKLNKALILKDDSGSIVGVKFS
ncbi:hypothetical protein CANARDRAFT_7476 [[Candida] arabinofermentans NRRL YB-2248]|uniref:Vacuolar protein-sorting-associated protein 25 n=1 Tax=[Candida] arabinofermentans NRRL YB-2248 TaxID=983967 RepID=A0A1E4T0Q7_9ASCO|nr:hypothetical protein CANARDRAFT_7476 [[Candida] arabinofermentans NRRL YB-2248]